MPARAEGELAPGRVVVAMSGGVDSSVAAAILKEEGYPVIGITMQLWSPAQPGGCCGDVEDARKVAYRLGIPHYVIDLRDIFRRQVVAEFCGEYSRGRTPNPCITCNRDIKFGALLERARGLGADLIATGHHARVEVDGASGRYLLRPGADRGKDQSYFLYSLTQEQLRHTRLPIGNLTKARVREIAGELGLPVAAKPGSQEICFIPDNDYPRFLRESVPQAARPGTIVDGEGNVRGEHEGIMFYTIGQRRRLGMSAGERLYVTAIDPEDNAITVGGKPELYRRELVASRLNWISIDGLEQPLTVSASIRYRHPAAEAVVTPRDGGQAHVRFREAQPAITPGQAVVFYRGDTVIGGGVIERAA